MQQLFALSLGFGAVLFLAGQAHGADCARRNQVVTTLADRYGEAREAIGLASNGAVIEVFASADGATWTITATLASGMTCLVASGEHYERLLETPPAPGNPA
jgi:hypothetical protein